MTISFPPASVSKERAKKYERFIVDKDQPAQVRQFAVQVYDTYRKTKDVGHIMAAELAWQMVYFFFIAKPTDRMLMTAKGKALRSQLEWQAHDAEKKRERDAR